MRAFINQDTNEPMTVYEARQKYGKDGRLICPLCGAAHWAAGWDVEDRYYFLECQECHTYLVEEE